LIVFNQTKEINIYAVENYERFSYETALMRDVGEALLAYDTQNKPVTVNVDDYRLPESLCHTRKSEHPFEKIYRNTICSVLDRILPQAYFVRMQRYGYNTELKTESIAAQIADNFAVYKSYIAWAGSFDVYFHKMMERLGYTYILCTDEQMENLPQMETPNDTASRFQIIETEDVIIVQMLPQP
jgi:hypothetical protein